MLHHHMEKHEAEKQEVLHLQHCYISQHAHEMKSTLRPTDRFKVFEDNAQIYADLVTLEWGQMYHHYGRRDPVLILPD